MDGRGRARGRRRAARRSFDGDAPGRGRRQAVRFAPCRAARWRVENVIGKRALECPTARRGWEPGLHVDHVDGDDLPTVERWCRRPALVARVGRRHYANSMIRICPTEAASFAVT